MSTNLFFTGLTLMLCAIFMLLWYLLKERGSIFDPISISWAGYILFINIAMISCSIDFPFSTTGKVRTLGCFFVIVGTFFYTIGLYSGNGSSIAKLIPIINQNLSKSRIWVLWLLSVSFFFVAYFARFFESISWMPATSYLAFGSLASIILISLLAIFSVKRSPITKFIMASFSIFAAVFFLNTIWSRRPLVGLLIAILGFIYQFKIRDSSKLVRLSFLFVCFFSIVTLTVYLSETRGHRFYSKTYSKPKSIFSEKMITDNLRGININYQAYELSIESVPKKYDYLYGKGYIPAFLFFIPRSVWPEKPVATGYFISQIWFKNKNPRSNLSPLPFGELYINFGFIGIVIGTFVGGKLVRILNTYLKGQLRNPIIWLAWLIILPDFATEWRGDFTSMTVQAFLRVSVFLALVWLIGKIPMIISPKRVPV